MNTDYKLQIAYYTIDIPLTYDTVLITSPQDILYWYNKLGHVQAGAMRINSDEWLPFVLNGQQNIIIHNNLDEFYTALIEGGEHLEKFRVQGRKLEWDS